MAQQRVEEVILVQVSKLVKKSVYSLGNTNSSTPPDVLTGQQWVFALTLRRSIFANRGGHWLWESYHCRWLILTWRQKFPGVILLA